MEENTTTTAPDNSAPVAESGGSPQGSMLATPSPTPESTPVSTGFLNENGEFATGWIDRLPKEYQENAAQYANFKDLPSLLKSYSHAQKMLGGKANAVQIPGEDATPEEKTEFFRKIGVPEDTKEYTVKPNNLPEGAAWDSDAIGKFNEIAHSNGVTPKAMNEIISAYAEYATVMTEKAALADKAQNDANRKALADEWGAKYDSNLALAKRAAQSVGADLNSPGFSDPAVVKAFQRLASHISDDRLVTSDSPATAMIGKARAMSIMRDESNPLYAKYRAGDPDTARLVTDLLKQG
jgi:hypothetical protein